MLYLLFFTAGVLIGSFIVYILTKKKAIGYLRIDHSDPMDPPYLFLELKTNIENIIDEKQVSLIVKRENFISQK